MDFRDYFDIEESKNCTNDFLEIRDGAHGYSELIGRFCGSEFPRMITSQDRFLWLRFKSDETLEYRGFKAVYEFRMQSTFKKSIFYVISLEFIIMSIEYFYIFKTLEPNTLTKFIYIISTTVLVYSRNSERNVNLLMQLMSSNPLILDFAKVKSSKFGSFLS